jgi:hypothetical protein
MPSVAHGDAVSNSLVTPEDSQPALARRPWDVVRAIIVDWYYFLALIAFFVLVWPILVGCHHVDQRYGTRSRDRLVRFCERF